MEHDELPTVWADESSQTGENLADLAQPVYAVGAVSINEHAAAELVTRVAAALPPNVGETKYTTVTNSNAGRNALVGALADLPPEAARAYLAHKRFMIAAKMIDLLVEPHAYDDGYDMYADGAAVGLANLLHFIGPVMGNATRYEAMLDTFVEALRRRATATIDDLYAAIADYVSTCEPRFADMLVMLTESRAYAERAIARVQSGTARDELDPAIPCLVVLCRDLGDRLGPFRLVHDASNVVARHALDLMHLDRFPDPTRPGRLIEPLSTITIDFAESGTAPQLQVADWVAGAARQWATSLVTGNKSAFTDRLELIARPWFVGALWPDEDKLSGPGP